MHKKNDSQMLSLFISDVDDGGAGIACQRVHDELNRQTNNKCGWLVAKKNANTWPSFGSLMTYELKRRLLKDECALVRASRAFYGANIANMGQRLNPRVLFFSNIHQKMSFDVLTAFPQDTPILIYLHDMWYLTGYCCFSMDCEKYVTGCQGICPQWGKWEVPTRGADVEWKRRESFYSKNAHRIHLIAPSQWMARCAEQRFKGSIVVERIANPVDTSLFRPVGDKRQIRQMLGFDGDRPLILCGAVTMKDQRKGFSYLKGALDRLRQRLDFPVTVAVFGTGVANGIIPDVVSLGTVRDERLLNLYYNAATTFVLPSLAESFGLVYAEAMAAGTPCVAFDSTASGELVQEGITGYLATLCDVNSLTDALERAVKAGDDNQLGRNCRTYAVENFDVHKIGGQHLALIEKVLAL